MLTDSYSLLQRISEAIFMLDRNGYIRYANPATTALTGYATPEEITGQHFSIFYTAQDIENRKPDRELAIATETRKYEAEDWRVKKNGSVFWASIILNALHDDQHQLIGFANITRDLTDHKQQAVTLPGSEEQYRLLVEQVVDYGIFMLDVNGNIISWNEGAKRIKGYREEEIIGKNFSVFYSEEDKRNDKPQHELKLAIANGRYEEEGWRVRKDGSTFWANVVITAVHNASGMLIGFSKVTRDLTERKAAEQELTQSYERYRLLSAELTTANEALSAANQELQRSNESLQQFAYIASHDLQEPLRKIQTFGEMLKTQYAVQLSDGTSYVERMQSAASRMSVLIQDLLQYASVATRQEVFSLVSLIEVIKLVLNDLEVVIKETGAEVIVDPLPAVKGDKSQLGQLIQNLFSNALKFRKPGILPVIRVRAQSVAAAHLPPTVKPALETADYLCLQIIDNGIGFEEKYKDQIFQIFQRLHSKHQYTGTGIGLAICEKIVLNHGGAITAQSQTGQGATFSIYLPANV